MSWAKRARDAVCVDGPQRDSSQEQTWSLSPGPCGFLPLILCVSVHSLLRPAPSACSRHSNPMAELEFTHLSGLAPASPHISVVFSPQVRHKEVHSQGLVGLLVDSS